MLICIDFLSQIEINIKKKKKMFYLYLLFTVNCLVFTMDVLSSVIFLSDCSKIKINLHNFYDLIITTKYIKYIKQKKV